MYRSTSKEQRLSLKELGFTPIWVEDLEDGEEIAIVKDCSHPSMQGVNPVEFMVAKNVKKVVSFQENSDGDVVQETKRINVKFFGYHEDGDIREESIWNGNPIWVKRDDSL